MLIFGEVSWRSGLLRSSEICDNYLCMLSVCADLYSERCYSLTNVL
jgi:hypothetical protein